MKTAKEWTTEIMQKTFRPDIEKIVANIQNDAQQELQKEIEKLEEKSRERNGFWGI